MALSIRYLRGVQEDAASQSDQFRRRRRARVYIGIRALRRKSGVYIGIAAASSAEP